MKITSFLVVCLVSIVIADPDSWTEFPSSPFERTEVTAASVGNKIYVIGGLDDNYNGALNKVEVFDAITQTWSNATNLPIGLHQASASSYNGLIYVVGGFTAGWGASKRVFQFDPNTNQWSELSSMNTSRGALTTSWANGLLYAIGGSSGNTPLATNEVYDPNLNQWTTRAPLTINNVPYPRDHLTSGVVNGKLYAIGGRKPFNLNLNLMYNPFDDTWEIKSPMPTNRSGIASAVYDNRIFVFGGEGAEVFNNTEEYVASEDLWKCRTAMPTGRHDMGAVVIGNYIFIVSGGNQPGHSITGTNEAYTPPERDTPGYCAPPSSSSHLTIGLALIVLMYLFV